MNETAKHFIEKLQEFHFELSGYDKIWRIIYKLSPRKWVYLQVVNYKKQYFISEILTNSTGIEINIEENFETKLNEGFGFRSYDSKSLKDWDKILVSAIEWMEIIKKDWINHNAQIINEFPLKYRKGTAPNAVVRELFPDFFRIDEALGKQKTEQFCKLVENHYFQKDENTIVAKLTANQFFEYCKIAYLACKCLKKVDKTASGLELYNTYADGRHEGLIDIDLDSETEFEDWLSGKHPKKDMGGHPWEILRGGNTTHISMYVSKTESYKAKGFTIRLAGAAHTRLPDTIRIFLAIQQKGYPITISEPEKIRLRLLAQDKIGIVPEQESLHRANQYFDSEEVFDVVYLENLWKKKKQILPFVQWDSLFLLRPIAI